MKRQIYVFMDSVSRNFGEPFTMDNETELRRYFDQIVLNPDVPAFAIRDTVVLHLGVFNADFDNPMIISNDVPIVILRGDSYNVDEIRKQNFVSTGSASELYSSKDC